MHTSIGSNLQGQPSTLSILMLKWFLPQSSNGLTGVTSQTMHMALIPEALPPLVTSPKLTDSKSQTVINTCATPLSWLCERAQFWIQGWEMSVRAYMHDKQPELLV